MSDHLSHLLAGHEDRAQEAWGSVNTLRDIRACAERWDGDVRIIGNVRAEDIVRAVDFALSIITAPSGAA